MMISMRTTIKKMIEPMLIMLMKSTSRTSEKLSSLNANLVRHQLNLLKLFFIFSPPTRILFSTPISLSRTQTNTASLSPYLTQVDDELKVTRSRKDCPHETCGAGVRMAVHKDRLHCGKCSLTFLLDGDNA